MIKPFKNLLFILVVLMLVSCGKKSPPLSPKDSVPEEFSFEVKPVQTGFTLIINLPVETKRGYPLTSIKNVIIEKKEIPLEDPKAKPKISYIKLTPKLHSAANIIVYDDVKVKHRYGYSYRIKIRKDILISSPWIELPQTFYWHNPPDIPRNLNISILDENRVILNWEKPYTDIKGNPLDLPVWFEIEKITPRGSVTLLIKDRTEHLDYIKQGEKTCYAVRSVLNFKDTLIPGMKTSLKCLEYR